MDMQNNLEIEKQNTKIEEEEEEEEDIENIDINEIDLDKGTPEYDALQNKINDDIKEEQDKEFFLIKTINTIYSDLQKQQIVSDLESDNTQNNNQNTQIETFNNFSDPILNDSIPKFVMLFFNLTSIDGVRISNDSHREIPNEKQIKNINAVIKFLSKKENKFNLLRLSFENVTRCECSTVLFYSNFLNFFFLKKSKEEMYDRCKTLFIGTKFEFIGLDNFRDLSNYMIYFQLINFILYGCFNNDLTLDKITDSNAKELYEGLKIPLVIDQNVLNTPLDRELPDCVFYQLQFIFDEIDSNKKKYSIIEILHKGIKLISSIKVPNYKALKISIDSKKSSKKYQLKRTQTYTEQGNKRLTKRKSSMQIQKLNYPSEHQHNEKSHFINLPDEFKQALTENNPDEKYKEFDNSNDDNQSQIDSVRFEESEIDKNSFNEFWNNPNHIYKYDHGILYDISNIEENKNLSIEQWNKEMEEIQKKVDKSISKDLENAPNIIGKAKLYKLLYYDEIGQKWLFHHENFMKFKEERFALDNSKTPFILFSDSYELDSIKIAAHLINSSKPNIEEFDDQLEDEICVYAFYEHPLSQLVFSDFSDLNMTNIKPLFFFLHVPLRFFEMDKLTNIVIQIYSFLSMICDFEVVILDKKRLIDQSSSIKSIMDIANSYYRIEKKKSKDVMEEDINNSFSISYKQTRIVFLINDNEIKYDPQLDRLVKKSTFFNSITNVNERKSSIHFIKIDDFKTYGSFIDNMAEICAESEKSYKITSIEKNFKYIERWESCDSFINLMMMKKNWKNILKKQIQDRYNQLNSDKASKKINISALSQLGLEIDQISPPFAKDFVEECYKVLSNLRHKASQKNRDQIKTELTLSSQSNLNSLIIHIKKYSFLTDKQMNNIKESHGNFLENEFFRIIQNINLDRIYDIVFEDNIDILQNQIENDKKQLDEIFKVFIDKINKKKNTIKKNIQEGIEQGVNYTMRERENLKEIKIIIHSEDDLEKEIPQDF